jgi:hypothetical protein
VTVDAHDADLADVLTRIAVGAEFALATSGDLGRITATFTTTSIERALRQLVQDHELMLVYARGSAPGDARLVQVEVYAATVPSRPAGRGGVPVASIPDDRGSRAERRRALAEITELGRSDDPEAAQRLTEMLATLSEPTLRVQAVYALRRTTNPAATATLGHLLLHDPDPRVRRAAARMLGSLSDPAAADALGAASAEADTSVQAEVRRALDRRGISAR